MAEKKLSKFHEFRAVYGKNIRVVELTDWSEDKLLQLIKFFDFFINPETDKLRVNKERIQEFEVRSESEAFWMEWRARIGIQTEDMGSKKAPEIASLYGKYKMRVMTMMRNVLGWLKNNPHRITSEMYPIMIRTERMSWALKDYKIVTGQTGAEMIEPDNLETTDPDRSNASPAQTNLKSADLYYERSMLRLASILNDLTKGIKSSDINKMNAKDRIGMALKIVDSVSKMQSAKKPSGAVFKQYNINNASVEEAEKMLMDYNQNQQWDRS